MIRVVAARPLSDSLIWVRFSDGVEAEIDLGDELHGTVFEPLRDAAYFRKVKVNPEIHTVVWPNGADFAPEFLYAKVSVPP
jgi:hypothetical protein